MLSTLWCLRYELKPVVRTAWSSEAGWNITVESPGIMAYLLARDEVTLFTRAIRRLTEKIEARCSIEDDEWLVKPVRLVDILALAEPPLATRLITPTPASAEYIVAMREHFDAALRDNGDRPVLLEMRDLTVSLVRKDMSESIVATFEP